MAYSSETQSEFCMFLQVSKDGQGMINVWQQQIQQFRNVSREMAAAIVAEYPSPQILKQTYEQCRSVQDAMLLLEDIMVIKLNLFILGSSISSKLFFLEVQ